MRQWNAQVSPVCHWRHFTGSKERPANVIPGIKSSSPTPIPEQPRGAVGGPRAAEAITGRAAHAPPTPPTAHHGLAPRTTHSGAALDGLGTHGSAGGGRRQRHLVVGVVGGGGGGGGHGHHHRRRQEHQHERPRGRPRASPAYLEVPHDPS